MARFADALAQNPVPSRLGDVRLRYEPSMLIGETAKPRRSLRPSLAWVAGIALLLFAVAALAQGNDGPALVLISLGGAAIAAAVRLERHEKRQRRFVVNFATLTLRLDFTTPVAGLPRTLLVPFDQVKAVELLEPGVLVVEFLHGERRLQEALVAFLTEDEAESAQRLHRVLRGAFGLGEAPKPFAFESSFEP